MVRKDTLGNIRGAAKWNLRVLWFKDVAQEMPEQHTVADVGVVPIRYHCSGPHTDRSVEIQRPTDFDGPICLPFF
ncbi:hypothetical protein [Aureliella helgolandensis]|uniref:hypothetical protein n=1 Tax=Aureliella helgolandensis TaxID=2527968 RepID=UPI0011A7D8B7|nr:hypothetical protein [Aureliella helgolandensis]